jgi:hypothetical protein
LGNRPDESLVLNTDNWHLKFTGIIKS